MGTGSSRNLDTSSHGSGDEREDQGGGGQLYVSLKMENNHTMLKSELIPHVYSSVPLVGSWDSPRALAMEQESTSMWELSFVVPPNHVEEGADRILTEEHCKGMEGRHCLE